MSGLPKQWQSASVFLHPITVLLAINRIFQSGLPSHYIDNSRLSVVIEKDDKNEYI